MKNIFIGFASALILIGVIYFAYGMLRGASNSGPVSPQNLKPGVNDYGTLQVAVFGKGAPLPDVEVDVGEVGSNGPTGPMSYAVTDTSGTALFENVPVGTYDVFFNTNHFPAGYMPPQRVPVSISQGQITQKRIDLAPK
jgi:hypothetical protein